MPALQTLLHETKNRIVSELDQGKEPAVRLEPVQRKDELLQIPIDAVQTEHTDTTEQELI